MQHRDELAPPRFGELAGEYEAFRVGYAPAVYDHLAAHAGLAPGARVVDVGCGTGLATAALVERGADVLGVEPEAGMREVAERHLAGRAQVVDGRAESLPVPDASVDLLVAAQAAHWFDQAAATREVLRVLRPGGSVAYVWKHSAPDEPYAYVVDELLGRLTGSAPRWGQVAGTIVELLGPGFEGYRRTVLEQPVPYTVESYVGYNASRESVRQRAGEHRGELLATLEQRLRELAPSGRFVERNLVYVFTARRS